MALHLLKLCVGCDTVEELLQWRAERSAAGEAWILRTRQTPRRQAELLAGGSLYRVFKGLILSRQRIMAVNTVDDGAARRCEITLAEEVVLTRPTPRRAFQGWRYLSLADAPEDLTQDVAAHGLTAELSRQLRDLGVW